MRPNGPDPGNDFVDPKAHGGNDVQTMDDATTIAEIKANMARLKEDETAVIARLNEAVAGQKTVLKDVGRLDLIRGQLGSQVVAARSISSHMLSDAAATAKRISGAVRRLDLEQARVKATLEVVEQVAELKACVHGVTGSMGAPQDWENAAGYLSRASKIPKEIVCGSFAEKTVPSVEVPDPPSVTLENAAESLCGLFLREFEKAAKEDNGPKVTRFFKLFPLIGRSEVGLNIYGRYVCQGVASRARSNLNTSTTAAQKREGLFYATALTKLFEYIAQIVERHGGLVERHYGEGSMIKVIERLQMEADTQGGIIISTWSEEQTIDRRLIDIRSYAFVFLVQSFLPQQNSKGPISRTGSPATFDRSTEHRSTEEDGVDVKEIDGYLNEMGLMLGKWSLYCRFLATKCADPRSAESGNTNLTMPSLLLESALMKRISEQIINPFNHMTTFYFRRSVEKAFQLDEQPADLSLNMSKQISSHAPHISSAVDDVMYIVAQVLTRSLSTAQRGVVSSVISTVARVLGSDFVGMIQRRMRDETYPKPAIQGGLPPEHVIIAFLVLLNNLDVATDYVRRIVQSKVETTTPSTTNGASTTDQSVGASAPTRILMDSFPFGNDAAFVGNALDSLQSSFQAKTAELINDGTFIIFRNVMKPRLRPILADTFRDIDYQLTEAEIDEINRQAEQDSEESIAAENVVLRRFQSGWEALTRPLARILTSQNFDRLLTTVIAYLGEVLEKRIWGYYGRVNGLGAIRLEKDIASIIGLVVRGGRYALRDSFTRCTQLCLLMNMEEEEWEEVKAQKEGEEGMEWKIDADERERARAIVRA